MADGFALLGEDPVHQIADGNHAGEPLPIQYWKMTDAMVRDDLHAFADGMLERDRDHRRTHDLGDGGFLGRAPLQDHFARIVALRDDAYDLAIEEHEQCADLLLSHHRDGIINRAQWRDGTDESTFLLQNWTNRLGKLHQRHLKSKDDKPIPRLLAEGKGSSFDQAALGKGLKQAASV